MTQKLHVTQILIRVAQNLEHCSTDFGVFVLWHKICCIVARSLLFRDTGSDVLLHRIWYIVALILVFLCCGTKSVA